MSDAASQRMKVSREGIVLIKSFEGFRPRAIQRQEGGWIIGYGHTLSAREGATVSEADAELLLRYDLLPVEKTLNDTVPPGLNQHQFDALVSFAFSVGLDRFAGSDVRQRLSAGARSEAADAMMGWPEPVLAQTALRRRVAERALFGADPAGPVALSDLLAAPLPPPPVMPMPEAEPVAALEVPAPPEPAVDLRGAAVATLLGETPSDIAPAAEPLEAPPESTVMVADDVAIAEPAEVADAPDPETPSSISEETAPEAPPIAPDEAPNPARPSIPVASGPRYAAYGAVMVGPLPFLQPVSPRIVAPEASAPDETPPAAPLIEAQTPAALEPAPTLWPAAEVAVMETASVAPLVLTSMDDAPEPVVVRALWTPEQRVEPTSSSEAGLFGEELSLTHGPGPILGYDDEREPPARFDWSETGAFIIMGAVGLTAFGASMAAFRLASEQADGGSDTTMIAWVLAVIGAACVGVSSFNLYRRWGLPGGD